MQDDDGCSESAVGHRRRIGYQRQAGGRQRIESEPDQDGAGHGHRRAAAGGAFEERPEAEGDQNELQPAVVGDAADAVLQDLEQPRLERHPVQENQVQDDPANGRGREQRSVKARTGSKLGRHADHKQCDDHCRNQAGYRRVVGANMKDPQPAEQHNDWNCADQRGQNGIAERIVNLRPDHDVSSPMFDFFIVWIDIDGCSWPSSNRRQV